MPVQSKNKEKKKQNDGLVNFLGINFSNWSHKNLLFWNFIVVLVTTVSWIFLCLGVIFLVIGNENENEKINTINSVFSNNKTSSNNGIEIAGIVFIAFFGCTWISLIILGYQKIILNAKEIDSISNLWLSYAIMCFPFIFSYVSYFVWKSDFSNDEELKNSDLNTNIHYEYEKKEETKNEVDFYRNKKEEILKKETNPNNHKQIKINGKPLTGNKKKRK